MTVAESDPQTDSDWEHCVSPSGETRTERTYVLFTHHSHN